VKNIVYKFFNTDEGSAYMLIGYLSPNKSPNELAELVSMTCKYKGISLLYLTPGDVKENSEKITGKMLFGNEWRKVTVPLPKYIDVSINCYKILTESQQLYLRNNTKLSETGLNRLSQVAVQENLLKDENLKEIIIPSDRILSGKRFYKFIYEHEQVILKPIAGQLEEQIYYLSVAENGFVLKTEKEERFIDKSELSTLYDNIFTQKKFIIQKFINSTTKQGYPFNCRINIMKNEKGKWEIARKYIQIGISQKFVSNLSQGEGISDVAPFLDSNLPGQRKVINQKLNRIAKTIPLKVEKLRKHNLITMGIDLGIDRSGDIYLFGIKSMPTTKNLRDKVALLKADYYYYISQNYESNIK